jgi:hypothetical protein
VYFFTAEVQAIQDWLLPILAFLVGVLKIYAIGGVATVGYLLMFSSVFVAVMTFLPLLIRMLKMTVFAVLPRSALFRFPLFLLIIALGFLLWFRAFSEIA